MNEFDNKLLNITLQNIKEYRKGNIELSRLISELSSCLSLLESVDQDWKNAFSGYWWDLEQIYAFALDQKRTVLNDSEQKIISHSINELENMITEKNFHELKEPNPEIKDFAEKIADNWLMCPHCQEAWESHSHLGMVQCPNCKNKLHNPRYTENNN